MSNMSRFGWDNIPPNSGNSGNHCSSESPYFRFDAFISLFLVTRFMLTYGLNSYDILKTCNSPIYSHVNDDRPILIGNICLFGMKGER